jgi:hypothetical protein
MDKLSTAHVKLADIVACTKPEKVIPQNACFDGKEGKFSPLPHKTENKEQGTVSNEKKCCLSLLIAPFSL